MLSSTLAQQIASETTEAIGYNVIITDAEGIVIGSGETGRVGSFHEASADVMRTQQSAWHTPEQARALRGVRPGITLPLVIAGEAVGTVGITGTPRQVRRFGLLVRRQTEILLEESDLVRSRLLRERAMEDLVGEVASYDPQVVDAELLAAGARELGFTLIRPRVALVVDVVDAPVGPELLRMLRSVFRHKEDIAATHGVSRCVVLASLRPRTIERVHADARRLIDLTGQRLDVAVRIGLGPAASSLEDMRDSCVDAADALWLGARVAPRQSVLHIDDLRAVQALAAVPGHGRDRLIGAEVGLLRQNNDWPQLRETVLAWCENGFNLVAASRQLHIHRNTLLYRLDKIERLGGRPWRDHRAMLTVYLACLADQVMAAGGASARSAQR